jgi:F-type H+-transporting ATPase subunit delta
VKRAAPGVARRYARALLDVALDKGDPSALRSELDQAAFLLREKKDLSALLSHPAVGAERKKQVLDKVFRAAGASDLLVRLLELLVERQRVALLPAVATAFADLSNAQRGVVAAEVVSATGLDEAQKAALRDAVGQLTGRQVELQASVEPAVLGGLLLKLGGLTYDGTLRARLRALRQRLGGASA